MAQQYGLGNAFADILGSYVQSRQINRQAQQDALNFDLRRQQFEADQAYRDRVLANEDRNYQRGLVNDAFSMYKDNEQLRLNQDANRRANQTSTIEQRKDDQAVADRARQENLQMAEAILPLEREFTIQDIMNPEYREGFRALNNIPEVREWAGGELNVVKIPNSEGQAPDGGALYSIEVFNDKTGTTGPLTSLRGRDGNEFVQFYDEQGIVDVLNVARQRATADLGYTPRSLAERQQGVMSEGRQAEQASVPDIRDLSVNPEVSGQTAAPNSRLALAEEIARQEAAPVAPTVDAAISNAVAQQDAARSSELETTRRSARVLEGLVKQAEKDYKAAAGTPQATARFQTLNKLQSDLQAAQNAIESQENALAASNQRRAAVTPTPAPVSAPLGAPAANPTSAPVTQADNVQSLVQGLTAPYLNRADQAANDFRRASSFTGITPTVDDVIAINRLANLDAIDRTQQANLLTSGDMDGSRREAQKQRMTSSQSMAENATTQARTLGSNVVDQAGQTQREDIKQREMTLRERIKNQGNSADDARTARDYMLDNILPQVYVNKDIDEDNQAFYGGKVSRAYASLPQAIRFQDPGAQELFAENVIDFQKDIMAYNNGQPVNKRGFLAWASDNVVANIVRDLGRADIDPNSIAGITIQAATASGLNARQFADQVLMPLGAKSGSISQEKVMALSKAIIAHRIDNGSAPSKTQIAKWTKELAGN